MRRKLNHRQNVLFCLFKLQWSRRTNAAETRQGKQHARRANVLQWSRRTNAAETWGRHSRPFPASVLLQWSRRTNAAETEGPTGPGRRGQALLQWSRRTNAAETTSGVCYPNPAIQAST